MENWDDLQFVLAAHRHGGLSGAARALGVNHATVSRRLAAMEDRMGVRLFDRFASGLKATPAGLQAVEAALTMEERVLDLNLSIAAKDQNLAGALKVSCPQLLIQRHLAEVAKDFLAVYPGIDLTLIATSDVNLHRREADVVLMAEPQMRGSLWGRRLFSQNRAYYGAPDLLDGLTAQTPLPCVDFHWHGDQPAPEVSATFPKARLVAKFDDMIAYLGALRCGMGIGRVPCFIGDAEPGLRRVPGLNKQPYVDFWILTHPDLQQVTRIRTFMRFAAEAFKARQAQFEGSEDLPL